jgi:hypothetical protein
MADYLVKCRVQDKVGIHGGASSVVPVIEVVQQTSQLVHQHDCAVVYFNISGSEG